MLLRAERAHQNRRRLLNVACGGAWLRSQRDQVRGGSPRLPDHAALCQHRVRPCGPNSTRGRRRSGPGKGEETGNTTPVLGISQRLGFVFYKLTGRGPRPVRVEIPQEPYWREHELLIVHRSFDERIRSAVAPRAGSPPPVPDRRRGARSGTRRTAGRAAPGSTPNRPFERRGPAAALRCRYRE